MLGYSKYWTAGADVAQWRAIFNPKHYNWVDFNFISVYFERDRKMHNWTVEVYLLGCRAWINFGWEDPDEEIMDALREVADDPKTTSGT
jgi:hypothetical protein